MVICHGMTNFYSLQIATLKKKLGFRLIYDDHTLLLFASRTGIIKALFYRWFDFNKIRRYADKIIGIADECVEVIIQKYKVPRERVEMIPLGADTKLFKFNESLRRDFRNELGISEDEIVITYAGKMTLDKAPHSIITAVTTIRNRLSRALLYLSREELLPSPLILFMD